MIEEETLSRHPSLKTDVVPAHRRQRASLPAVMPSHDIYGFSRVAETIDEAEEEPTVTSQILKPVQHTKEITSCMLLWIDYGFFTFVGKLRDCIYYSFVLKPFTF